jgi:hypothetical protein
LLAGPIEQSVRFVNSIVGTVANTVPDARLTFDHCAIWMPGTNFYACLEASEIGPLSIDARSTWFEVDRLWVGKGAGRLTWTGNRNVFTSERSAWMVAPADPMLLNLESWRNNRKSDADSAWVAPMFHDPAAWRLNENVVGKDSANLGADCSRVLRGPQQPGASRGSSGVEK